MTVFNIVQSVYIFMLYGQTCLKINRLSFVIVIVIVINKFTAKTCLQNATKYFSHIFIVTAGLNKGLLWTSTKIHRAKV